MVKKGKGKGRRGGRGKGVENNAKNRETDSLLSPWKACLKADGKGNKGEGEGRKGKGNLLNSSARKERD